MRLPYYRILEYMAFRLAVYRPVLPESKSRWCSFGNTWRNIHSLAFFFVVVNGNEHKPLARILNDIAHATLQSLRLAIRHTLAHPALSPLLAYRSVRHGRRLWTLRMSTRATRLLLARRILRITALDTRRHILAVLATRRILVAANGSLIATQLAVLVATGVVILGAEETGIALFVALDAQITAKGLFGFGKTSTGFGLEDFADGAERAGGEFLCEEI